MSESQLRLNPYLSFKGDCEAAFKLYERCFGAQLGLIFRYAGTPMENDVPADWSDKIMHGSIIIAGTTLMAADVAPQHYQEPQGYSLSLHLNDVAEAERIFNELAQGGRVLVPLDRTFWAALFGMVVDRFGIPWLINCESTDDAASL